MTEHNVFAFLNHRRKDFAWSCTVSSCSVARHDRYAAGGMADDLSQCEMAPVGVSAVCAQQCSMDCWGVVSQAYSLVFLQIGLFAINLKGVEKLEVAKV